MMFYGLMKGMDDAGLTSLTEDDITITPKAGIRYSLIRAVTMRIPIKHVIGRLHKEDGAHFISYRKQSDHIIAYDKQLSFSIETMIPITMLSSYHSNAKMENKKISSRWNFL